MPEPQPQDWVEGLAPPQLQLPAEPQPQAQREAPVSGVIPREGFSW
jgi:hypothetical protein